MWQNGKNKLKCYAISPHRLQPQDICLSIDHDNGFCPYLRYLKFDALDKEDYPNGIADNSVFIMFEIDLFNKKVEVAQTGCIWLSPKDKTLPQYKYLCMKSMTDVLVDRQRWQEVQKARFQGHGRPIQENGNLLQKRHAVCHRIHWGLSL